MKPHVNIGIIGHCSTLSRPLMSELIAVITAKVLTDTGKDVKIVWIEPDQDELLEKLFLAERHEYRIERFPGMFEGIIPIPILNNKSVRSEFDFKKSKKEEKFQEGYKVTEHQN